WMRRHRTAVTGLVAAALVALVGLAGGLAVQGRAQPDLAPQKARLTPANRPAAPGHAQPAPAHDPGPGRVRPGRGAVKTFHTGVSEDVLLKRPEFDELRTKLLRSAREFYRRLEDLLQGQADPRSRAALGRAYFEVGYLTANIGSKEEALAVYRRALD